MTTARIVSQIVMVAAMLVALMSPAHAFKPTKPPPPGWNGEVKFGAHATGGASRSKQILASTDLSYSGEVVESRLTLALSRTSSSVVALQTDADGQPLVGDDGVQQKRVIKARTFDRRFVGIQPHWYWSDRSYLMGIVDWESNEPIDIDQSLRLIIGVGHKLWNHKHDMLAAEIGFGEKRLLQVSGLRSDAAIGYLGLKFVRDLSDRTRASVELDSDFGSGNRFTEVKLGLRYKLTQTVAVKFRFASRVNSDIRHPGNPLGSDADSESAIYLEIDMF